MRPMYLLFINTSLCVFAVIYMATRPQELSPVTERAIHAAVAEAVPAPSLDADL